MGTARRFRHHSRHRMSRAAALMLRFRGEHPSLFRPPGSRCRSMARFKPEPDRNPVTHSAFQRTLEAGKPAPACPSIKLSSVDYAFGHTRRTIISSQDAQTPRRHDRALAGSRRRVHPGACRTGLRVNNRPAPQVETEDRTTRLEIGIAPARCRLPQARVSPAGSRRAAFQG